MQFAEIGESKVEVVERVRPPGMTGQLDALPGGEVGKDLPSGFFQLFFDELDFLFETDAQRMGFRMLSEVFQLVLEFDDRFFEIELVFHAL